MTGYTQENSESHMAASYTGYGRRWYNGWSVPLYWLQGKGHCKQVKVQKTRLAMPRQNTKRPWLVRQVRITVVRKTGNINLKNKYLILFCT